MGQAAVYYRVSTNHHLCERQERDLRAFAKRAGRKIVAVFRETASGADNARPERAKVLALARADEIDAILVTELSRWGRSPQDLVQTLDDLHRWKVSVLAQTGLSFDLSTANGKLMRTIMGGLGRVRAGPDPHRVKVRPGSRARPRRQARPATRCAHQTRRRSGCWPCTREGLSYRLIGRNVGLSKNTVMQIVRRVDQ